MNIKLYLQMIKKQRKNIDDKYRLSYSDIKRICKYVDNSIFENNCSKWNGYITYNKNYYISFYFNNTKVALHRLLYINFIGDLNENIYLTCNCNCKGCINLNCFNIKNNKYTKNIVTPKKSNKKKSIIVTIF